MSSQLGPCATVPAPSRDWLTLKPKHQLLVSQHALLRRDSGKPWFRMQRIYRQNASIQRIHDRDQYRCVYCRKDLRDAPNPTIDHLIPQSCFQFRSVANQDTNRATCCLDCNRLKSDWTPALGAVAWRNRLSFLAAAGDEIARRKRLRGDRKGSCHDLKQMLIAASGIVRRYNAKGSLRWSRLGVSDIVEGPKRGHVRNPETSWLRCAIHPRHRFSSEGATDPETAVNRAGHARPHSLRQPERFPSD